MGKPAKTEISELTLTWEGGYVWHPKDYGGPTAFGVTCWTLADLAGVDRPIYPRNQEELNSPDVQAFFRKMDLVVRQLTKEEAKRILYTQFVQRPKITQLPVEIIDQVADMAVNMGPKNALKLTQKVLREITEDEIPTTGVMDANTSRAAKAVVAQVGGELVNDALALARADYYLSLNRPAFTRGWLRRAAAFASSERAKRTILGMIPT